MSRNCVENEQFSVIDFLVHLLDTGCGFNGTLVKSLVFLSCAA